MEKEFKPLAGTVRCGLGHECKQIAQCLALTLLIYYYVRDSWGEGGRYEYVMTPKNKKAL